MAASRSAALEYQWVRLQSAPSSFANGSPGLSDTRKPKGLFWLTGALRRLCDWQMFIADGLYLLKSFGEGDRLFA